MTPVENRGSGITSTVRGGLTAVGSWFERAKQGFKDTFEVYDHDPMTTSLAVSAVGVTAIGGALGALLVIKVIQGPGAEYYHDQLVSSVQEAHASYAQGLVQGFHLSGTRLPEETTALIESLAPDKPGRVLRDRDQLFHVMRQAGMFAAMSGDYDPDQLAAYARYIERMPQKVRALRDRITEDLDHLTGDPRCEDVANMVVTLGLIGTQGELSSPDLRQALYDVGAGLRSDIARSVTDVLTSGADRASELSAASNHGPDPEGMRRMLGEVVVQDLERFMRYKNGLALGGPEI
jgi:hypothetical protein